jgi:hypothetical protein
MSHGRTGAHAKGKHSSARKDFDNFVRGYIDAALWSSHDESDEGGGGEPMDRNYSRSDIASSSLKSMKRDCARFMKKNRAALTQYATHRVHRSSEGTAMDFAGHDFWLTRNGHGTGFWDRDYGGHDEIGEKLTEASKKFGTSDMYVGDDGEIYVSPEK